jgi:hypothetical protein
MFGLARISFLIIVMALIVVSIILSFAVAASAFADPTDEPPSRHSSKSAQSASAGQPAPVEDFHSLQNNDETRIVIDQKKHVVRVLVGRKEILTIDASGLRINGGITYSGQLTATGEARHAE